MVGNDGFIGIPIIHKAYTSPYRVMVQTPVTAVKIQTEVVSAELDRASALRHLLSGYAHVHETQLVQAVVCNLYHSVEQRLARRLLVTSNYLQSDALALTQEHLGRKLENYRLKSRGSASRNLKDRIQLVCRRAAT